MDRKEILRERENVLQDLIEKLTDGPPFNHIKYHTEYDHEGGNVMSYCFHRTIGWLI